MPLIQPGDDLASHIIQELIAQKLNLEDGDILTVAQKVVSKSENRYLDISTLVPSDEAISLSKKINKDPNFIQAILNESKQVVRHRMGVLIVEHKLGFIHANAGIDRSNIDQSIDQILLLPKNPDLSARILCNTIGKHFNKNIGVFDSAMIKNFVGDGSSWGLNVTYSEENPVLETAGGIKNALPYLGDEPFAVINADIFSNFDYAKLKLIELNNSSDGHLVLVKNPEHNQAGDFGLLDNDCLAANSDILYTFSGIAVYHPKFFNGIESGIKMQLLPLLKSAISKSLIKGELFKGIWSDIGTPERLEIINKRD